MDKINWQLAVQEFRGSHLIKLVPAMLSENGYEQVLTDAKKNSTSTAVFDKDFVLDRFSNMLSDLNLFKAEDIEPLLDDILEYHIKNAIDKQSDEISSLIAKYGKEAVKALLK